MNDKKNDISLNATWFVGASYGGTDDQVFGLSCQRRLAYRLES